MTPAQHCIKAVHEQDDTNIEEEIALICGLKTIL